MPSKTLTKSHGVRMASTASLDEWAQREWRDGTSIADLQPLDELVVHTLNSRYEIVIVSPGDADVAVRGGAYFPNFARVRVAGSSLGGSFLKLHAIHVGFRMEFLLASRSIVTSPVRTIAIARPGAPM
jgi:hypothetical protein